MALLTKNQCLRAIDMLQVGLANNIVAIHFGVYRNTIVIVEASLLRRCRQSGNTRDRQRQGHPRVTSRQQEIDSKRQVALQEASLDYDQSALEQFAIYFVIITSGHDVQHSVQFCCLGTMQLGWYSVDIIWDSEDKIVPIYCSHLNPIST